jgi:hypothetical protein
MCGDDGTASNIEALVRRRYGEDIDHPKWLEGFVDGAVAKFREIESKLE